MNDGWQRPQQPEPPRPVEASVDVPLAGEGPLATRVVGADAEPPPPNWRRIIRLSSLAGVVLGVLVSVVLIGVVWDDDGPEDGIAGDPSTTIDGFDLATVITTPPTLDPLVATPPAVTAPQPRVTLNLPTTTTAPIPEDPETTGTLPAYPRYSGIPEGGLDSFDLAPAVEALDEDVARRSQTHYEFGGPENTLVVTIVRDPINNRYGLSVAGLGDTQDAVIDIDAGVSYVTDATGTWVQWPNSGLIAGVSAATISDYFDNLLLGPVRPDTLPVATVAPLTMVFFEGTDAIAREFAVELPGGVVPEWQYYVFSPITSLPEELRPELMNYLAYVDEGGNLSRVHGTAEVRDVTQLVIHRVERLEFPEIVLLPDPALVTLLDEGSDTGTADSP